MFTNLFFHQPTKPLALASSTVSGSLSRRLLPMRNDQAFQSNRTWLQGAVRYGKSNIHLGCLHFILPVKDSLASSTCDVAALPSLHLVLLGKTGISSSAVALSS
jgi:hypothetical protein